jgi:hypothetical protein
MLLALFTAAALATQPPPSTITPCSTVASGPDALLPAAVRIETSLGSGSGVLVSPDGYIFTAAHVVGSAEAPKVVLHDGASVQGKVLRYNSATDLALVAIDVSATACAPLASARGAVGSDVFLIGSPGGDALTNTVTKGIISAYREEGGWTVLQTDASVSPGSSGGMVASPAGQVLGVVSFKAVGMGVEGLGFAMAAENVEKALGISFGESSGEIEEWREESGPSAVSSATVEDRPDNPEPPLDGKRTCADVKIGEDAFSGVKTLSAKGADLFEIAWVSGQNPILSLRLSLLSPLALDSRAQRPGGVEVDFKLLDGTKIHMVSSGAKPAIGMMGGWLIVNFQVTPEVISAIASSGPILQRWTVGESHSDAERSERQAKKYFRPMFSCAVNNMIE